MMEKKSFKSKRAMKENDWAYKEKLENLDEKYSKIKDILKQVMKDLQEEKDHHYTLIKENEKLKSELKERDDLLEQMRSVSEAVIDEYSALKVKCDLETEAANNAIKRATKYFEENKKLKRCSNNDSSENQTLNSNELQTEICNDEVETESELEVLNKLSSELRTEVASLKTQLSKEIEKQTTLREDFEIAKQLYEQEMKEHNETKEKLNSVQKLYHRKISSIADSDSYVKPLKRSSLPQPNLQEKEMDVLVDRRVSDPVENWDIVTKLDIAEKQLVSNESERKELLKRVQELEVLVKKLRAEVSVADTLPVAPPPPPPPPPSFNPIKSLITFIHHGKKAAKVPKKETVEVENNQHKAMSEMIDAIKQGKVYLKPTPKNAPSPEKIKTTEDSALGEMKNILATLKKRNCTEESKPSCHEESSSECVQSIEMSDTEYSKSISIEHSNVDSNIDEDQEDPETCLNHETTSDVLENSIGEDIPERNLESCKPSTDIQSETNCMFSEQALEDHIESSNECDKTEENNSEKDSNECDKTEENNSEKDSNECDKTEENNFEEDCNRIFYL